MLSAIAIQDKACHATAGHATDHAILFDVVKIDPADHRTIDTFPSEESARDLCRQLNIACYSYGWDALSGYRVEARDGSTDGMGLPVVDDEDADADAADYGVDAAYEPTEEEWEEVRTIAGDLGHDGELSPEEQDLLTFTVSDREWRDDYLDPEESLEREADQMAWERDVVRRELSWEV